MKFTYISSSYKVIFLLIMPSLWPFVNFLNENVSENFSIRNFSIYALFTLFFVLVIFLFLKYFLLKKKSHIQVSVILASLIITFFSYSLTAKLANFLFGGAFLKLWVFIFLIILIISFLLSAKKIFQNFVFLISLSLFLIPFTQLIILNANILIFKQPVFISKNDDSKIITESNLVHKNNVFFIVLDQYGRYDVLKELFNFENSNFLKDLKNRNFFIANNSSSNYVRTVFSMPSVFSKDYVFNSNVKSKEQISLATSVFSNETEVIKFFKKNKYKVASLIYNGSNCDTKNVDYCFSTSRLSFSDLEVNLLKLTPLWSIRHFVDDFLTMQLSYYEFTDMQKYLETVNWKNNNFAYMHLLMPHGPFRFSSNCDRLKTFDSNKVKGYINQIKCSNSSFLKLFDFIKENDPKSIVILASDHGPRTFWLEKTPRKEFFKGYKHLESLNRMDIAYQENLFKNLLAMHIPDDLSCSKYLSNDLTLVNLFRIVESCLTETEPKLLKNRWFHYDEKNQKFIELN